MNWDFVILVPMMCVEENRTVIERLSQDDDVFIEQMNNILKYEVIDDIYKNISRHFIGTHMLKFFKNWPEYHAVELPQIIGNVYLSIEKSTGICICEIVANLDTDEYLTYYLDAIPKNDIFIDDASDKAVKLCDFVKGLGFMQVGTPKSCVYLAETPPKKILTYILASEFFIEDDDAFIDSELLENKLKCDLSQYDFLKCYATANNVVNIMRIFHDNYADRLYFEGMSIFLVELILFQIAAITRTNNRVVELLSKGDIPSLETIKDINLQYARTITLWNINIFRSTTAQLAANQMYQAFDVPALIEQYERNQKMMEHIISIKSQIEQSKHTDQQNDENNILGVLAAFTVLSAICDGFSDIDFFISFEETLKQIQALSVIDIISIFLKLFIFVYIMVLSLPSLVIIYKNGHKKRHEKKRRNNQK